MILSDLMSYAAVWREASDMPPATPFALVPLVITDERLDELRDGSGLTREQWLRVAYHGVIVLPHQMRLPDNWCDCDLHSCLACDCWHRLHGAMSP